MIFHEAPHKLKTTLSDLRDTFGATRRISLCRELTKLNEEVLRLTLAEAVAYYEENAPRGEYVREHLRAAGEEFFELGKVVEGNKQTIMKGGVFGE